MTGAGDYSVTLNNMKLVHWPLMAAARPGPSSLNQMNKNIARPTEFKVAVPAVWNALPPHLRSSYVSRGQFRAGLKTHLFTQAYGHL